MNLVLDTINNHRSIRSYTSDSVSDEHLNAIIEAAQMAPSSINGQQMSIIIVKEPQKKKEIAALAGNQVYIEEAPLLLVFCADFYRAHLACQKQGVPFQAIDHLEATLIGSIDVGLAMANAITASESLGLGTVPIGGIRNHPEDIITLLNLPQYVFPLCGLLIGHPLDHSNKKPRLPKEAVVFNETYNPNLSPLLDQYDKTIENYMFDRSNGASSRNWTTTISNSYQKSARNDTKSIMAKQGFNNN